MLVVCTGSPVAALSSLSLAGFSEAVVDRDDPEEGRHTAAVD